RHRHRQDHPSASDHRRIDRHGRRGIRRRLHRSAAAAQALKRFFRVQNALLSLGERAEYSAFPLREEHVMAGWRIEGEYMESCNCTFVCPCIGSNLAARPSEGDCKAALAMRIGKGEKDGVKLDGVAFIVLLHSPGAMAEGNMTVGLIVDQRASDAQAKAIADIATGAAGGPMAALGPLVGKVAGVEKRPIRFEKHGMNFTVTAGELI